jgi:hypothetical protein
MFKLYDPNLMIQIYCTEEGYNSLGISLHRDPMDWSKKQAIHPNVEFLSDETKWKPFVFFSVEITNSFDDNILITFPARNV